jgi:hypothetical protein
VRYRVPRTRTIPLVHLGLALGAVAAAMLVVMTEVAAAASQRLVLIRGVSSTPSERYEAIALHRTRTGTGHDQRQASLTVTTPSIDHRDRQHRL